MQQIEVDSVKVNLAFLTEITSLLTFLNLKLQGQDQNIAQLVGNLDALKAKLNQLKCSISKSEFLHLPKLMSVAVNITEDHITEFEHMISDLQEQFEERFQDVESLRPDLELFSSPMSCKIENQKP